VLRGIPTVIDDERIKGFQDGIKDTELKILDIQYANWNGDQAFKLMQDYLAKYPHIDAVWASDDDMVLGVLDAVKQAGRTDIKYALGGNGMKEIIKKGDRRRCEYADRDPYPPPMIKTAIHGVQILVAVDGVVRGKQVGALGACE
jgi:ribose transport system substrate-binding protein